MKTGQKSLIYCGSAMKQWRFNYFSTILLARASDVLA